MTERARSPNEVLDGPVLRTFFRFAGSSLLGLLAISSATVIDTIFVGSVLGADALAAINFLLPYFTFLFSACLALAVGGSVRAGKYLGQGNQAAASAMFGKSVLGALLFAVGVTVWGLIWSRELYGLLGIPPALYPLVDLYLPAVSLSLVLQLVTMVIYYFVRLDGSPILATAALVTGAVVNIALDATFIVGLGLGLPGAAHATAIAQAVQLGLLLCHFKKPTRVLYFSIPTKGYGELLRAAGNGAPDFINEVSVGIIILVMNRLLVRDGGVVEVAAFAAVHILIFAGTMLYFGLCDALHTLVSINLGALRWTRIASFMRAAVWTVAGFAISFTLLLVLFGDAWINLLLRQEDTATIRTARYFTLLVAPLFLVSGFNILLTIYHTAVQQPLLASTIALSRTLIGPLLALVALRLALPGQSPVAALAMAEWATFGLAIFLHRRSGRVHRLRQAHSQRTAKPSSLTGISPRQVETW